LVPLIVLGTIALAYQGASDQIEGEQELGGSLWDLVIDILTGV
jgi:hypothetical protein